MSRFLSSRLEKLKPYTPGEQPQDMKYVKLNTNESPFPPSPVAVRMARQEAGSLQLYSDPVCRKLMDACAGRYGVEPEETVFGNGSDELLNFAMMAYCDKDHGAVAADITYGFYPVIADINCVPYTEIPLRDDFTLDPGDFADTGKTVFIANPNAPTGKALGTGEIRRIIESNRNSVVVIDEAYIDFGGESCVPLIHEYGNLIVVQTMSKSRSLAGGRLGFAFACRDIIADLNAVRFSVNPYNVNRMTMAAGVGAFADDTYFRECTGKIRATRKRTAARLKDLGFEMPDSLANFIFAKHPSVSGGELYKKLKQKGVLVRHFDKDRIKDYIRITIGSDDQMDILFEKITEILEEKQ